MILPSNTDASMADGMQANRGSWALIRWLVCYDTVSVPQAAGPIAFALLALPLTGNPRSGAAIMLTITVAQVIGAVMVGSVLASLSTSYSLQLDVLAPVDRKAEVFALSRTATTIGVILTSTVLTLTSLAATQVVAAVVVCAAITAVAIASFAGRTVQP